LLKIINALKNRRVTEMSDMFEMLSSVFSPKQVIEMVEVNGVFEMKH
jgi:hypothetical protein